MHLRIDENKIIFQPIYSSSGSQVAGTSPGSLGPKAGPNLGQDTLPPQDADIGISTSLLKKKKSGSIRRKGEVDVSG